ncbi:MAG: flippase-like domain-containing protein [Chloroflexota bacterium]|nr:flippase-like domain-containing protein [Chloroflexota bacterium]
MTIKDVQDSNPSPEDGYPAETTVEKKASVLPPQDAAAVSTPTGEITRAQLSLRKRILNWRTLLPLVVVVIALVIFARQAKIDPQKTLAAIRSANALYLLAAFIIYYLSFPLRALRWRFLLQNVGFTRANGVHLPKFWKIVEIIYISWFANAIVPAKLGDLYRAYLLRRETGVSGSRSFGTVLAERLLDLIVLLLLCISAVMISLHDTMPWQVRFGLIIALAAVIAGVIGLFMLRLFRTHIARIVPLRFREHYNHLQEGTLGSFRHLPTLIGLTLGVWACESLRFFFVVLSLNLIRGDLLHIIAAALFIALVEALLTAIPFTGGGVGLVEGGMIATIALFTPNTTNLALAAIVLDRSISLLSILVIGFVVFMIAFGRQATKQSATA